MTEQRLQEIENWMRDNVTPYVAHLPGHEGAAIMRELLAEVKRYHEARQLFASWVQPVEPTEGQNAP